MFTLMLLTGAVQRLLQEFGRIKGPAVDQSEPFPGGNKNLPAFKFEFITQDSTSTELKKLKCNKSSGLDNIPPRLLKDSATIIAKPLTKIINASLMTEVVPDVWKRAKVTPVFKKGKRSEMDNYRPISVLPVASKILERAVHRQLYQFLTENKILNPSGKITPLSQQQYPLQIRYDGVWTKDSLLAQFY